MTTRQTESFGERKRRLRQSYLAQFPQRLARARELLSLLAAGGTDRQRLDELHLIFHTLKGTGASLGFDSINLPANACEQAVREALDADAGINEPLRDRLSRSLQRLEELAVDAGERLREADKQAWPTLADADDQHRAVHRRQIYLCDDDPVLAEELAGQLGYFGYQVIPLVTLDALRQAFAEELPGAVIMDVIFPEGQDAGPQVMAELNAGRDDPVPSIFMSNRDDFQARLNAVRAGGQAYCPKPVKAVEMAELLDQLTNPHPPEPFRILIVDDDPDIAQFFSAVLEESGMLTKVVCEPERVPGVLKGFDADLVLMDLYMPHCSGPDLARVLRQIPGYLSLPIIYVSAETNVDRQFQALEVGADGFITKPLEPGRLVAEVHLRAERMRTLRSLMIRDSLTGLFNHNTILQMLGVTLAACKRQQRPLCMVMLDVDHFKKVNDSYGHPAGDQVLMALGRTLRLRLREVDLIGRYGGEEFALVLAGIEPERAKGVMDNLREGFAALSFFADGIEFHCTFSAGIAAYPEFQSTSSLVDAADRALYRAKAQGRNRVEIAHTTAATGAEPAAAAPSAAGR